MKTKYRIGEKVRFKFHKYETRVGIIKKVKRRLFNNKYCIVLEYPLEITEEGESAICFYDIGENKIIERVSPAYKGWC